MLNVMSSLLNEKFSILNPMHMGDRIKEARLESGFSQEALGDRVGVSKGAVSQWESGNTKNLKMENLFGIEDVTGYSAKWLAVGKGEKKLADLIKPIEPQALKGELDGLTNADLAILLRSIADRL